MSFVDPTPRLRSAQQHSDDSGVPGIIVFDAIEELLTDPVTVAESMESGEVTPLVQSLAGSIYDVLVRLLGYL
mgnify:CR=1 FL=1